MGICFASEKYDINRIDKLNKLNNIKTFWDDVRKLVKNITSDHAIRQWQALAEIRYDELALGKNLDNWENYLDVLNKRRAYR